VAKKKADRFRILERCSHDGTDQFGTRPHRPLKFKKDEIVTPKNEYEEQVMAHLVRLGLARRETGASKPTPKAQAKE
jgi:hypothetical protein